MGGKLKIRFLDSLSPRHRKLVYWAAGLLLFYTVTGFFILPPIIRSVAVKQLSKQLDREVSIQKVKLNPFAFSTAIRGLLIKDKDGEPFVSWDEVYVNFQLSSFLGHPWVFKRIKVVSPFVRAQMNKDGTFNFSDLIAKFTPTNAPATPPPPPAKPIGLYIGFVLITNATASVTDLTHRQPFKRLIGPVDFTLENFYTDPANKNPHQFTGTTDAGESIAWTGSFHLNPLRSQGELTLENLALNKYAPLYQDQVPFEIRDGLVGLHVEYRVNLGTTNDMMSVTNTSFTLRNFKLAEPGAEKNLVELARLAVTGVSAHALTRRAEVDSVFADGGRIYFLRPARTAAHPVATNAVASAPPAETSTNAPGGIAALLGMVTNSVALLLHTTNRATGLIRDVEFTNCAFHLEDLTPSRPARLDLDDIALSVRNISNEPKTNLAVGAFLRWNTNGAIKTDVSVSLAPLAADVQFALDRLDFGTLDPYLESKLNLFIPSSQFGLHGQVHVRTPEAQLPEISFHGDTWIDNLRVVDGVLGEDLLKWKSVRVSGIEANVNPPSANIREIALDSIAAQVVIETNRTINLLAALSPVGATNLVLATNAPAVTNATVAAAEPTRLRTNPPAPAELPPIAIGTIAISNNSASFTDRSLVPNVHMAVLDFGGIIAGLSSSPSERAAVNLSARVDGVGPVDISGHINPFSLTGNKDLKVVVTNMDLTPASPYSGKYAGYRIARGKLDLNLDYDIAGRNLKAKNVIRLDRFTFGEKVTSPDATHLPVRLAIALLKDRNGQILLDVPVEGSLDDPKFRVGKVVWHTVLNLLTKAATSPFSLLGALVGGAGEELSYQDFAPGSAALSPDCQKKLDLLVKALYERPGLQLEITGSIDPQADRDGLRRISLEKQIRSRRWQSLRKSERAATTPDQLTLTADEYSAWVKKLYGEAVGKGVINEAFIAAHTNLAAVAGQIKPVSTGPVKGATWLMRRTSGSPESKPASPAAAPAPPAPSGDPMETMMMATIPITDADFQALAAERAKAVRAYLLQSGKVEAERLFITENRTGGVRSDGSRVYLQFQ